MCLNEGVRIALEEKKKARLDWLSNRILKYVRRESGEGQVCIREQKCKENMVVRESKKQEDEIMGDH